MSEELLAKQQAWLALGEEESALAGEAREALAGCAAALAVLGENLLAEGYTWGQMERLALEIVRRTRAKVGKNFIIIFRLSMLDLVQGGSTKEEGAIGPRPWRPRASAF